METSLGHVHVEDHSVASSNDHQTTAVAAAGTGVVLPSVEINTGSPVDDVGVIGTRAPSSPLVGTEVENVVALPPPPPAKQQNQILGKDGGLGDGCEGANADNSKSGAIGIPTPGKDAIDYELVACAVCCRTPQLSPQLSLSYCLKRSKNKTGVRHCPRLKVVLEEMMRGDASVCLKDCQALLVQGQRESAAGEKEAIGDIAVEVLRITPANLLWRFMVPCEQCSGLGVCMQRGHVQVKTLAELMSPPSTPPSEPPLLHRGVAPPDSPRGHSYTGCSRAPVELEGGKKDEASHALQEDLRRGASSISAQLPVGDLCMCSDRRKNIPGDFSVNDNVKTIVNDAWRIAMAQGNTAEGLLRMRALRCLLSWQGHDGRVSQLVAARVLNVWMMSHPREEGLLRALIRKNIDKEFRFQMPSDGPIAVYRASQLGVDYDAIFAAHDAGHGAFAGERVHLWSSPLVEQLLATASSKSSKEASREGIGGGGGSIPRAGTQKDATAPTVSSRGLLAHIPAVDVPPSAQSLPRRGRVEKRSGTSGGSCSPKRVNFVPPCDNAASIGAPTVSQSSKRPQAKSVSFAKRRAFPGGPAPIVGCSQQDRGSPMGAARSDGEKQQAERARYSCPPLAQQPPQKIKIEQCDANDATPKARKTQTQTQTKRKQRETCQAVSVEESSIPETDERSSPPTATMEAGAAEANAAARRAAWLLAVQENDARLKRAQDMLDRTKEAHVARSSELMRWMVEEQSGNHDPRRRDGPPILPRRTMHNGSS